MIAWHRGAYLSGGYGQVAVSPFRVGSPPTPQSTLQLSLSGQFVTVHPVAGQVTSQSSLQLTTHEVAVLHSTSHAGPAHSMAQSDPAWHITSHSVVPVQL